MIQDKAEGTFLVTGATGFIGSAIVREILNINKVNLKNKNKVIIVARDEKKISKKFGDILQCDNVKKYVYENNQELIIEEEIDWIICAGAATKKSFFLNYPTNTLIDNILGVYQCLELARKKNIKGFLFISSVQVYGRIEGNSIKENTFGELDCMLDEAVYPESKRAGEALVQAYYKQYKVPTKIIRLFHVYGQGEKYDNGTFLSDFFNNISNNENIVIKGSGKEIRNLCHIHDVVNAILLVLHIGNAGEVYNVGSDKNNYSIREIADMLSEVSKSLGKSIEVKMDNNEGVDKSIIHKQIPDIHKLLALGWKEEKYNLKSNFREMLKN